MLIMNDLISIIVPVYNVEESLPRCLESIASQTYKNIEVILIDDESTDNSGNICDEYVKKDSRFIVIHKKNSGVNEARLSGFNSSKGDFVTFIDSDDYVSPLYVERLYDPIRLGKSFMSCVQWFYVKEDELKPDKRLRLGYFDRNGIIDILKTDFLFDYKNNTNAFNLGLCCKLIKRDFLIGAMEQARGLWLGEDLIANLYMMYHIPSIFISSEHLYYYVQHSQQSTRQGNSEAWKNQVKQWERIIELDEKSYLSEQLPYRILKFFKLFLYNNIEQKNSYSVFRDDILGVLQYDIIDRYFYRYHFHSLKICDQLLIYIVRKNFNVVLYYMLKFFIPVFKVSRFVLRKIHFK